MGILPLRAARLTKPILRPLLVHPAKDVAFLGGLLLSCGPYEAAPGLHIMAHTPPGSRRRPA